MNFFIAGSGSGLDAAEVIRTDDLRVLFIFLSVFLLLAEKRDLKERMKQTSFIHLFICRGVSFTLI